MRLLTSFTPIYTEKRQAAHGPRARDQAHIPLFWGALVAAGGGDRVARPLVPLVLLVVAVAVELTIWLGHVWLDHVWLDRVWLDPVWLLGSALVRGRGAGHLPDEELLKRLLLDDFVDELRERLARTKAGDAAAACGWGVDGAGRAPGCCVG